MAWNGSNGKNTNGISAAKRHAGGAKKSPSVMRGAFAALAVVALAAGAWWWIARSGGTPAEPTEDVRPKEKKAVEPRKPSPPPAKTEQAPKEERLTEREKRLKYYRDKYGDNIPENLKPVVYFLENPPQKTFRIQGDTPYLRHPSERHIAGLVLKEPGTFFVMKPEYGEAFDKDFVNALVDKIEVNDDDPEDVRRMKEEVELVKKEIAAICRKEGKTPSEVMNEQAAAMFELGRYQRDLEAELDRIYDNPDLSDAEVDDFCKAANKMLEGKGLAPLALPDMTRRSVRLAYNEKVAARKAAQNQKETAR